jgi:hypothetical protein
MERRGVLTKIMAIAGTVLVLLPVAAPVVFAVMSVFQRRPFRFDWFIPAELFPVVLVGGALLLASVLLADARRKPVIWSLAAAVVLLVCGQVFAMVTGLSSGAAEPTGWKWWITAGSIIGYAVAVAAAGVGGVLLVLDLFRHPRPPG